MHLWLKYIVQWICSKLKTNFMSEWQQTVTRISINKGSCYLNSYQSSIHNKIVLKIRISFEFQYILRFNDPLTREITLRKITFEFLFFVISLCKIHCTEGWQLLVSVLINLHFYVIEKEKKTHTELSPLKTDLRVLIARTWIHNCKH